MTRMEGSRALQITRDPGNETAPADRNEDDIDRVALPLDLGRDRPLSANDPGIAVRGNVGHTFLDRRPLRFELADDRILTGEAELDAIRGEGLDLGLRDRFGQINHPFSTELRKRVGDGGGVVSGGGSHDGSGAFPATQGQDLVHRAPELEGSRELLVLELEADIGAAGLAQVGRPLERRLANVRSYASFRGLNFGQDFIFAHTPYSS